MGIYDDVQAYLNQGLPSIDPIFGNYSATNNPYETNFEPAATPAASPSGLTAEQLRLLLLQQNQGGGRDDGYTGFGDFGNLIEDSEKTFNTFEMDDKGNWQPKELKGYKHATSGLYQTLEGLNIDHFGNFGFGKKPTTGSLASIKERKDLIARMGPTLDAIAHAKGISNPYDASRKGAIGRRPTSGDNKGPPSTHTSHAQDTASKAGHSPGSAAAGTGGYSYDSGGRRGHGYGLARGGLAGLWPR